jgi:phosphocarrier protein HPr
MMLAAGQGTQLSLVATGPDAEEAIDAIADLIAQRFHESA